jgi:hypothetical protein
MPSERALTDDFEITRLMLRKELQNLSRHQQKIYDSRMLKDVLYDPPG